jgi:hypothetical protein
MPRDAHAKDQTAFRFAPELLARLKDGAKRHGQTMTDIVARGTEAELDRLDGITTDPGPVESVSPPRRKPRQAEAPAPPARFREPESASDIMAALRRRGQEAQS